MSEKESEYAVLGGGCFWCVEAVYQRINGVRSAVSGYAGGSFPNPTYQEVSAGDTGHAEVVKVEYDPDIISYKEILSIFWKSHNPTTRNQQGVDIGTQYRSIILYEHEDQQRLAQESIKNVQDHFDQPIVTQVMKLTDFYKAEIYHQDYFALNPQASYCQFVISPKLQKLGLSGDV